MPDLVARAAVAAIVCLIAGAATAQPSPIVTIDRLVEHTSTVPAVAGQKIDLFVREKVPAKMLEQGSGKARAARSRCSSTAASRRDARLRCALSRLSVDGAPGARRLRRVRHGHDRLRPVGPADDGRPVQPRTRRTRSRWCRTKLKEPCEPNYPFELVSSDSETADIDRVVDFIRALRGVDRITLIGWSGGGIRTGTFSPVTPRRWTSMSSTPRRTTVARIPTLRPHVAQAGRAHGDPGARGGRGPALARHRQVPGHDRAGHAGNDLEAGPWPIRSRPNGVRAACARRSAPIGAGIRHGAKIKVPTLIMVGEEDDLIASNPRPARRSRRPGQDVPRHCLRDAFRELGEAASRAPPRVAGMAEKGTLAGQTPGCSAPTRTRRSANVDGGWLQAAGAPRIHT